MENESREWCSLRSVNKSGQTQQQGFAKSSMDSKQETNSRIGICPIPRNLIHKTLSIIEKHTYSRETKQFFIELIKVISLNGWVTYSYESLDIPFPIGL